MDKIIKHYAVIGSKDGGKGVAMADATSSSQAKEKLKRQGVYPFHEPKQVPSDLGHGDSIHEVHDDGVISARIGGKNLVLTSEGRAFKEVSQEEKDAIKARLKRRINELKERLVNSLGKSSSHSSHRLSKTNPQGQFKMGRMHRAKNGGLTRRRNA